MKSAIGNRQSAIYALLALWAASAPSALLGAGPADHTAELHGARPYDGRGDDHAVDQIEWKESWEATYKANLARWESEVRRLTTDEQERSLRIRTRVARLLDALIARYPNEPQRRLEALKEIAGNYYACGLTSRGNYALRRLVEEVPGQADLVADALHRILEESRWEEPWATEEGREWVGWAASRLIALTSTGQMREGHPAVLTAWRALAVLRREQGRLLASFEALEALESLSGRDDWWLQAEADLYFAAGRDRDALPRYQDLHARSEQNWRARDRAGFILAYPAMTTPPSYSCHFGLETKWETIRNSPPANVVERIGEVYRDDAEGKNVLPWKDARHASVWALLDRHLLAQPPEALVELRRSQEAEAARLKITDFRFQISKPTICNLQSAIALASWRRLPWATTSQRALLAAAEEELRAGRPGLALRSFQDVLSHASDAALRAKAETALELAKTQLAGLRVSQSAIGNLQAAMSRLPPGRLWPPELFTLPLPPELAEAIWPLLIQPQACADGILVAGPELLAFFGGDDMSRPLWTAAASGLRGKQGRQEVSDSQMLVIPGRFRPAIADGCVYTRWGLEPTRRFLTDIAAFDLKTGQMLWSTADEPAWRHLWPAGDPTVADGRLYVLALRAGYAGVVPVSTVSLVCLDARSGGLLWERALAAQNVALIPSAYSPYRDYQFDLAHYGNAVTVADGAVYCQTNMGFVARCDARDGVVEWGYAYPRVTLRWNVPGVVRRQGTAPIVCATAAPGCGTVAFLPRDGCGPFALDAATGKLLWENPFAPSGQALGLCDGALVVAERGELAALDVATGRPRWRRSFPEDLRVAPDLIGGSIYVVTGGAGHRIEAATGRSIADFRCPMSDFSIGNQQSAIGNGPPGPGALRLPLARSWRLPRSNPTLIVPPPDAGLDGKVLVLSQGVLECVRATPQGGVEWQCWLPPGHRSIVWTEGSMLLIYPRSVAALDTATGRMRWHTAVPFTILHWQDAGAFLVLGEFSDSERGRRTCVLDLASGKLLWHREFSELGSGYFRGIGWDGKAIHLFASLEQYPGGGHFDVVCQPSDGRITAIRPFLPKGRQWPFLFDVGEGFGFFVDQDKVAYDFALDGSPPLRHSANLRDLLPQTALQLRRVRKRRTLQQSEQWILIHQYEDYPLFRHTQWVLQRGNAAYELRRPRPGVVRGNQLFEVDGPSLRIVDLPSRNEVAHLKLTSTPNRIPRILDYQEEGGSVLVVSGVERGPHWDLHPYRVQLDAFEKATGRHIASQVLDDVPYWKFAVHRDWRDHPHHETQVAWGSGVVLISDAEGLAAFAPTPPSDKLSERQVHVAHRVSKTMHCDGWLDDWDPRTALAIQGPGGKTGSLFIAHDEASLRLAVSYPTPFAQARRGGGDYGWGDWLEVAIGHRRLTLGPDDRGRASFGQSRIAGAAAALRHDLANQTMTYQVTIPLDALVTRDSDQRWRRIGVSVAVWQTAPGAPPARILAWGNAPWAGTIIPEYHEAIYLSPFTREGEEAGLALAEQLPELDEAWSFFRDSSELRAAARPSAAVVERYRDYLKRHPSGLAAERALVALDRALRVSMDSDPSPTVLRIATEAGVPDAIRARYARLAKAYISLWLWIDPKRPPAGLMLQFHDGRERGGWNHRVALGSNPPWRDWGRPGTPANQEVPTLPKPDAWHELRIPLVWVDLQDKPICGVSFGQHGGGQAVWDRLAVVYDGGERLVIDDDIPKAKEVRGQLSWVAEPRKSGSRAWTIANTGGPSDTVYRNIEDLQSPVVEHLIPPAAGGVLSQWVYLDPAKPPRTIALNLQARGDPWRVLWGQPGTEARFMGPLPPPGQWHELRVPLAWTPYAAWPLRGIVFETVGGRAYWDRTAMIADGKEHVVIDDTMPEGSSRGDWHWVEAPVKSAKRAHTHPPGDGYEAHGVLYLREPFAQHVSFEPASAALLLQEQIPKLGNTRAAWQFFDVLCSLPSSERRRTDRIRWFLSVLPEHPEVPSLLKWLLEYYKDVKEPDPLAAMDRVMEESNLPRATRYAFRRQYGSSEASFIRTWRMLGPFPNPNGTGHAKPFPPETEPVALDKDYDVVGGQARWRFHNSAENYIDLARLFKPNEHVVAYAVCWLRAPKAMPVSFEVGSDDGVKLWLNRKLLLDHREVRAAEPRQHTVPAELRAGWNEVLVKVEQGIRMWGFYLELLDRDARGLLKEVSLSATPPAAP